MKYKSPKLHLDSNRIKITLVISPSKFVATHTSNNHQTQVNRRANYSTIEFLLLPSPLIKPRREISSSLSRLILYNKCPPPPVFRGGREKIGQLPDSWTWQQPGRNQPPGIADGMN